MSFALKEFTLKNIYYFLQSTKRLIFAKRYKQFQMIANRAAACPQCVKAGECIGTGIEMGCGCDFLDIALSDKSCPGFNL